MTVTKAPVRQQSYLTEWDRKMAEYLRQMGGSIGPQDIASEAYGGKFPVGTMTAKILSGVLAGGADRRAMNRDAQSKRAAVELMRTPQTEITQDTAVGDAIYNAETDSYSTVSAAPVVAGVEGQKRDEFEKNELAKQYAKLGPEAITRLQQSDVTIPKVLRQEYIPLNEREVLQPRESTAGMTIAGSAENPNWVERQLGDIGGKTVSSRAELAQLAGYDALQFSEYERKRNAKKPPEYKPMGGELTLYNKNNNQEIRAQRYLVINSDGTISNVLMNIQTGELEKDPNQFTFEKPEKGSFKYDSGLTDVVITTPDGGIPARAQMQYDHEGAMTGMARFNGELVKVSTLDYKKVDALKPFEVEDFEIKVNKDWKATPIVKTYNDASNQIGKLNAIREMQITLKDKPKEFSEYVRNTLGLSKNTLASFEKTIEELGDGKAVSAGIMDWATIFLFNKMLDEQSVVRDPEVKQTMDSAGFAEGIATWLQGLEDGEKIGEQVRQGISISANIMFKSIEDRYKNELKTNADRIAIWKSRDNPATNTISYRAILGNTLQLIDKDGLLYNDGNPW